MELNGSATPNEKPGQCAKCEGRGYVHLSRVVHYELTPDGRQVCRSKTGKCFGCLGSGVQNSRDIKRNNNYNKYGRRW